MTDRIAVGSNVSPPKRWIALDTLVVTTTLPVLRVDLGANLSDLE